MTQRTVLSQPELDAFLAKHLAWRVDAGMLVRTFEAPTFLEGIAFVDQVAKLAEAADHHPDIDVRWRKVTLRFVTHDAGNRITTLDVRLAAECDALFSAHLKLG